MEDKTFKVGQQVWCVVRHSKHLYSVQSGMVVGSDADTVSYSSEGCVKFAPVSEVFGTETQASARKTELESLGRV